ncbi:maleylpyruvate isomerase family mycothiol-dependent enzyme [Actinopolymorpha alba]|uniref:maleylpyruvate isomerase family mycothiol-dependent enzyme n=1 Tax=Actinopolymorpha alba TaxID=533267 RepID=UPI00037AD649|nr:maleylpyruvate isomerase family mycothiol-dependent enzyme [Actinopolymorpha alba]
MTDLPHSAYQPAFYQARLREQADAFRTTVAGGPPSAPVAACPGWTLRDLVDHLGGVHQWATAIVVTGRGPTHPTVDLADGDDPATWYAGHAARLLDVLAATDPDQPTWTFHPAYTTARFWSRRQFHETAVHRVDAELALGLDAAYDADLAVDGINEVLDVMLPRATQRFGAPDLAAPVLLACADRAERWLLRPPAADAGTTSGDAASVPPTADGPLIPESTAAQAAATIRGTAAGLLLTLWKRQVPELDAAPNYGGDHPQRAGAALTVEGDAEVVARLLGSKLTP